MRLIVIFLFLNFLSHPVLAIDAPILISPSNNTTVTSSKLEWQTPSYPIYTQGSPYVVQIKNIPTFTSQDDRYKTNTYYTPKLSDGNWYWRVKAKNSDGIWSDWSTTWSFNLTTSTPTTTPTTSPSPIPTSSTTSPTSSPSTSSFTFSNIPPQINSDQSFNVLVNLSLPNNPTTTFYLKGAFKKSDSSNYFGQTLVSGAWIKNGSSYSSQYPITTDSSGNWSGNLEVEPDSEDSGFTGTDNYTFKVGRYSSSGSGPTWSNEQTIKITGSQSSQSSTTTSNSPAKSSSPTSSPSSQNKQGLSSSKTSNTTTSKSYDSLDYHNASVAGEATSTATASTTPSPTTEVKGNKLNFLPWIGGGFVLAGISSLIFIYLRAKKNL